jgi:molecular chaperone GrpE (heat shock protein)
MINSQNTEPDIVSSISADTREPSEQSAQPGVDAVIEQSPSADEVLAEIKSELTQLVELCSSFAARLEALESVTNTTAKQVSFLPPQLRQMSSKVDGLNTSISEPRHHSVLLSVLGVYDLVDQVLRVLPQNSDVEDAAHASQRRDYEVFRTQLLQILHANGLSEIPAAGEFDPKYHRAVKRVVVADPSMSDQVLELVRPGFRTEHAVLRYAEVVVSHYAAEATSSQ